MADQRKFEGWAEIEDYLGMTSKTILQHGYPIKRLGRVFAYQNELDQHRETLEMGADFLSHSAAKTA